VHRQDSLGLKAGLLLVLPCSPHVIDYARSSPAAFLQYGATTTVRESHPTLADSRVSGQSSFPLFAGGLKLRSVIRGCGDQGFALHLFRAPQQTSAFRNVFSPPQWRGRTTGFCAYIPHRLVLENCMLPVLHTRSLDSADRLAQVMRKCPQLLRALG
jgi:hypothetical protein